MYQSPTMLQGANDRQSTIHDGLSESPSEDKEKPKLSLYGEPQANQKLPALDLAPPHVWQLGTRLSPKTLTHYRAPQSP